MANFFYVGWRYYKCYRCYKYYMNSYYTYNTYNSYNTYNKKEVAKQATSLIYFFISLPPSGVSSIGKAATLPHPTPIP